MNCKYCEAPLSKKGKICHRCGRFLGEETPVEKSDHTKRNIWIVFCMATIAAIFVLTTFGGNFMQQKAADEHLTKQVEVASANSLGISFEKLKTAYDDNPYAKKVGISLRDVEIVKGEKEDTFRYASNDKLLFTGVISKYDHKLMEFRIVELPSQSQQDLLKWVTAMGIAIDTFSPEVPENERKGILQELGFYQDADLSKADRTAVRGDKKYRFNFIGQVGYVFSVTHVNYHL